MTTTTSPTENRSEASPSLPKLPDNAGYLKLIMYKPKRKDYLVRALKIVLGRGTEDTDKFCAIVSSFFALFRKGQRNFF